jgi:hypothetical protein
MTGDGLLQCALNAGEGRVQFGAETLHDRNDSDGDAGGDEAIFDGSLVVKRRLMPASRSNLSDLVTTS